MNERLPVWMRKSLQVIFLIAFSCHAATNWYYIDSRLTIQPIQVCSTDGSSRANADLVTYAAETARVYAQAGIEVRFLPVVAYSNSVYNSVNPDDFAENSLLSLALIPGHGQSPDSRVINLFFVKSIDGGAYGYSLQSVSNFAGIWTFQNGVAVADLALNGTIVDICAHEIGHNLGMTHTSHDAAGSTNLMVPGRVWPSSIVDITPGGAKLSQLNSSQIAFLRSLTNTSSYFVTNLPSAERYWYPRPPAITSQPESQTNGAGSTAIFAVTNTGTPPLSYQWQFNGTNLAGQINSTLILTNIQTPNAGSYQVLITNPGDTVTSQVAILSVNHSPTVSATNLLVRLLTNLAKISISELLTNAADPDGDALSFLSASPSSTNAGSITTNQGWVIYHPPNNQATNVDAFSYTVSDGHGGLATGWVLVHTLVALGETQVKQTDHSLLIQLSGIPGLFYRIEASTNLLD